MDSGARLKPLDITPIMGMLLLLLVFFMLMPGFVMQPGIKVNLPKAVTSGAVTYKDLEVVISDENKIYIDGKTISIQDLKALFKQAAQTKAAILIKADRRASLGVITEIWDMCRYLGIKQVNIVTNQE
ncbi:MAG: biopolymer transporter ExbD [Candidatus Omnitrophica bacterium]|jgi:biopolymer transport protein ExbD|nr:biopolymer transporter ExbD [Candidatus Omnitrophota bacterium]